MFRKTYSFGVLKLKYNLNNIFPNVWLRIPSIDLHNLGFKMFFHRNFLFSSIFVFGSNSSAICSNLLKLSCIIWMDKVRTPFKTFRPVLSLIQNFFSMFCKFCWIKHVVLIFQSRESKLWHKLQYIFSYILLKMFDHWLNIYSRHLYIVIIPLFS